METLHELIADCLNYFMYQLEIVEIYLHAIEIQIISV